LEKKKLEAEQNLKNSKDAEVEEEKKDAEKRIAKKKK